MRITPLDIRKQEFRKTMRGLDSDEVYAFLSTVAEEYEAVLSDNKRLREHIVELEERLGEYKQIETNLRNTLLTAERVTAEAKENARREAGLIVREAEMEAEKAAEAIRAHTLQLRREILDLKTQKDNYLTRLKTLSDSHRKTIEGFEGDFAPIDREIEEIGKKVASDVRMVPPSQRMSRDKITEDFAHGPSDKVTWGDEEKREEEQRPTFPRPGWKGTRAPGEEGEQLESVSADNPITEAAATQASEEQDMFQMKVEPIGAVDDVPPHREPGSFTEEAPDAESASTREENEQLNEGSSEELRQNVARSIEEKLYPEAHMNGNKAPAGDSARPVAAAPDAGPGGAPTAAPSQDAAGMQQPEVHAQREPAEGRQPDGAAPAAGAPAQEVQAGTATRETHAERSDDWKGYEVKESKPDWSRYEVHRTDASRDAVESPPSDTEVDKALSGLTEIGGGDGASQTPPEGMMPRQPEKPAAQQAGPTEAREQPSPGFGPAPADGKPHAQQVSDDSADQTVDGADGADSTWSMEELRKNLSNFAQDEGDQE